MLFLVIQKMKPGVVFTPEMLDLNLASFEIFKDLEKKGIIKSMFGFADNTGGCGIVDVQSADQLFQMLATLPNSGLVDHEVYPLVTIDVVAETMQKIKEKMAEMKK